MKWLTFLHKLQGYNALKVCQSATMANTEGGDMDAFVQWVSSHPVAHVGSAWDAWCAQQHEIDHLHAEVMALRERCLHLQQIAFEAQQRKLRLVSAA